MAEKTMRKFQNKLFKMLAAAYLDHDKVSMIPGSIEYGAAKIRLQTIKEIAKLAGVHRTERKRCAVNSCGSILELGSIYRYCSDACKQKAYRIRQGQMRR